MHITTERLLIRPIVAEDWQAVGAIWAALAPLPMAQYDMPFNLDPDDIRARIARWADFTRRGTEHMFFAVCLQPSEEQTLTENQPKAVGYIACNQRENGHEIGYSFHPAYHRKGYAKEALTALLARLHDLDITRFCAGTALNNTPSVKLLTALSFQLVGTEKVSFYKDAAGNDIVFDGGIFELDLNGGTPA